MSDNPVGYYETGEKHGLPMDKIKISPSKFHQFFSGDKYKWAEYTLSGVSDFDGNTGSCTGNIIHYLAECYIEDRKPPQGDIDSYITGLKASDDIDPVEIERRYQEMYDNLEHHYLSQHKWVMAEPYLWENMGKYCVLAGSIDAVRKVTEEEISNGASPDQVVVVDFKSSSAKTAVKRNEKKHDYQAMLYCMMLSNADYDVYGYEIVHITPFFEKGSKYGNKTKNSVPTVTPIFKEYSHSDNFIKSYGMLDLVVDTCDIVVDDTSIQWAIFGDLRLKSQPYDMSKYKPTKEQRKLRG